MSEVFGYWGPGSCEETEERLARSLEQIATTASRFTLQHLTNNNKTGSTGAMACWGDHARLKQSAASGLIVASLAASGLPTDRDIAVEVSRDSLRLKRDSFGRAVLYWTRISDVIWFASRLELLLPILESRNIAIDGLYGYGCFSFVPAPLTPIENVFAVQSGSETVWLLGDDSGDDCGLSRETVSTQEWIESNQQIVDEAEATLLLRGNLETAIRNQIEALPSGPVGVFLSGGLDSSITAALLVRAGVGVRAYTLDFGEYGFSELPFAEQVAKALSIPLVKVAASPREIRRAIGATAIGLDAPFGDGVTVPLFLLNEAASGDTTVVFNGEGGDQLFGGWTNKPLIASSVYREHHPDGAGFRREYLRTFHRLHGYEQAVYTEKLRSIIDRLNPLDWLADSLDQRFTRSLLHFLRRANLMIKGAQNIQPRATALGLAHGLMVRTPFCDRSLAEWTFQLAGELCLRGPCEKYLLKRAVEDWLPAEVVWREKRGMGVPLTRWCLGPLWRVIGEWLGPDALEAEGRFQSDLPLRVAQGQLSGHVRGRRIGEILWLLLMWQVWRKMTLNEQSKQSDYNSPWLSPRWLQRRLRDRETLQ